MRKVNGKLEAFTPVVETDKTEIVTQPTIEERLEAVEAALLEQLLRGLENV